jgi:hypothetical protein
MIMSYHGSGIFGASDEATDTYDPAETEGMIFESTDDQLQAQAEVQQAQANSGQTTSWSPSPGTVGPDGTIAPTPSVTVYKPPSVPVVNKPGFNIASLMQGKTPWIIGGVAVAVFLLAMASKKKTARSHA